MTSLGAPQAAPVAPALRTPPATQGPERMRQAAQAFEAQVLGQLLQPAFATVDSSRSAFGGGSAEGQWRPMLVDAFAAAAARGGRGIGLQEMVLRHMLRVHDPISMYKGGVPSNYIRSPQSSPQITAIRPSLASASACRALRSSLRKTS